MNEEAIAAALDNWHGDVLFVGVNYGAESKKHECKIEKFVKSL